MQPVTVIVNSVSWFLSGEVSKLVCEEYDDTFDAIAFPIFSLIFTVSMAVGGYTAFQSESLAVTLIGVNAILWAFVIGLYTITATIASAVYATENTELPPEAKDHGSEVN